MKKPPSAKARAAKKKREKMDITSSDVEARINDAHERAWGGNLMERSYPSTAMIDESDLLTAEEAEAQATAYLGKKGPPEGVDIVPWDVELDAQYDKALQSACDAETFLDDDMPDFLHTAAKAGPPLDHLGRTNKERKERKIKDAIALGEQPQLPAIIANDQPQPHARVITFMRDHDLKYPDLYMAVFVAGDWEVKDDESRFARLMARSGCYRADTVEDADLVIFGGGSDVEPLLYGEDNDHAHPTVAFNEKRDAADIDIYLRCRNEGVAMMGVCRGAQFLHVMNGGKLVQDQDGHYGPHKAFAIHEKLMIENVSSVHHQSCVYNKAGGMDVLLTTSQQTTVRWLNADEKDTKPKIDIEAFFYRDTGCFGVQGHPEYSGYNKYSVWCLEKLSDLFLCSPDFEWTGKRLRMTKTAREASMMGPSAERLKETQEIAAAYIENAYNQSKEA